MSAPGDEPYEGMTAADAWEQSGGRVQEVQEHDCFTGETVRRAPTAAERILHQSVKDAYNLRLNHELLKREALERLRARAAEPTPTPMHTGYPGTVTEQPNLLTTSDLKDLLTALGLGSDGE